MKKHRQTWPKNPAQEFCSTEKLPGNPEVAVEALPEQMKLKVKFVTFKGLSIILGRSEGSLRYHFRRGRFRASAQFGQSYSFDPEEVIHDLRRGIKR